MKNVFIAIAVLFCFSATAQKSLSLDSVFLKSGEVLVGKIINSDKFYVNLEQQSTGNNLQIKQGIIERVSANNVVEIQSSVVYNIADAGEELMSASGYLSAGTILSIIGPSLAITSVFLDGQKENVRYAVAGAGIGLSLVGLVCTLSGFAKIGNAGKVLQDIHVGKTARLDIDYFGTSAAVRLRF
jgi:sRNA-binding regulator protein Hfq